MSVYKAILGVQADLARLGVSKDQTNTFDKYKFRGIDDIYNALAPLLAKHGLCVLPKVLSRESVERESKNGGALFYVTVTVEYAFVSAEDGSNHLVVSVGEAMDRGDKATNKAMSAAYKYACFQAFCIPTEGDNDADNATHEVKPSPNSKAVKLAKQSAKESHPIARQLSELITGTDSVATNLAWAAMSDAEKSEVWPLLNTNEKAFIRSLKVAA